MPKAAIRGAHARADKIECAECMGARFGVACAGSRVITGALGADRARGLSDVDGVTMAEDVTWEHKSLNADLEAALTIGEIPEEYCYQMEQQKGSKEHGCSVADRPAQVAEIASVLKDKVSVLVGHSGVGKSTLINDLVPAAHRLTGDVNDVTGRGRHTSSSAIALELPAGGWIIDTPGIRAFGLAHRDPREIVEAFPDLADVAATCMSHCSHAEESCALNQWIIEVPALQSERQLRVESLRSLLDVKSYVDLPHEQ